MLSLRTIVLTALLSLICTLPLQGDIGTLVAPSPFSVVSSGADVRSSSADSPLPAVRHVGIEAEKARATAILMAQDSIVIHCLYCVNRPETGEFMYTTLPTFCKGGNPEGGMELSSFEEGEGCTPCAVVNPGGGGSDHLLGMEQWECNSWSWQPGSCPTMSCQEGGDPEEFAALSRAIDDGDLETLGSLLSVVSSAWFDPVQRTIFLTDCATERITAVRISIPAASALISVQTAAAPLRAPVGVE